MARLILSDGTREIDLIGTPPDGIYLVEFNLPIASKANTYARGADQEGSSRVRSIADNAVSEGNLLRIDQIDGTGADFWDDVANLQDLVASAHRNKGTLLWDPDEADGQPITYDLESIEITGLPQDGPRMAKRLCEPTFRFECKPYGRLDPVSLVSGEVISGPLDYFDALIPGHEEAFCELTLVETSTQSSDHIEVGVDYRPDTSGDSYRQDGDDLDIVDANGNSLAGSATTRAGSLSTNIIRATLTTTPVVVCSTGALPHVGKKKIRTRVYASATTVYVRVAWRAGDARFQPGPWREVPSSADWFDIALDVIDIPEVPEGTHSWEAYIEAYTTVPGTTIDVDVVEYLPADRYALIRKELVVDTAGIFSARSSFDTESGAITGDSLALGGAWTVVTNSDTNDFSAAAGVATRSDASDTGTALISGRGVTAGTTAYTAIVAEIDLKTSDASVASTLGLLLRMASGGAAGVVASVTPGFPTTGGTVTRLGIGSATLDLRHVDVPNIRAGVFYTLRAMILADGTWALWFGPQGAPKFVASGRHADLATGGALASGRVGFFDTLGNPGTATRTYDNFAAWVPTIDHALWSGQSAKLQHDRYLRENSAGTRFGRLPIEGKYLRVAPSSESAQERRFVIKRRRLDNDGGLPDQGTSDAMTADLVASQRVSLLG